MEKIALLLDTNFWLDDLKKSKDSEIESLRFWLEKGLIKLILPELILEEWIRNKNTVKEQLIKQFNAEFEITNRFLSKTKGSISLLDDQLSYRIEQRILDIENLLREAVKIDISDKTKQDIFDLSSSKKAPFHSKGNPKNSTNDAAIFLSALQYCISNNVDLLIFISNNYTDFAENKQNSQTLHPDLVEIAGDQKVLYARSLRHLISTNGILPPHKENEEKSNLLHETKMFPRLEPELSNEPLLRALSISLDVIQSEIPYLPKHLISSIYPFEISGDSYSYVGGTSLYTNNYELFEVLSLVEVQDNGKIAFKGELNEFGDVNIEEIVTKLNSNLIFSFYNRNDHKKIELINDQIPSDDDCPLTAYSTMQFSLSWKLRLWKEGDTVMDCLKKALVCFHFKDYINSYRSLVKGKELAKRRRKVILYFICLKNLKILSKEWYWIGEKRENLSAIKNELKSIDINSVLTELRLQNYENIEIIEYIAGDDFGFTGLYETTKLLREIRDYKRVIEYGGWGGNSHIDNLINEYAEFDFFLNQNCLFWHHYVEFDLINKNFLEGLLLSYSTQAGVRFSFFGNYEIQRIILFCDSNEFRNFLRQNQIDRIEYESQNKSKRDFADWISNLLSDSEFIKRENTCSQLPHTFSRNYECILANTFVFAGLIDFEPDQEERIFYYILNYFENQKWVKRIGEAYKGFWFYLNQKNKKLTSAMLWQLEILIFKSPLFHNHGAFQGLYRLSNSHSDFKLLNSSDQILKFMFDNCNICDERHERSILGICFQMSSKENQDLISEVLEAELAIKYNRELYITAALYGIVDHEFYWEKFVEESKRDKDRSIAPFYEGNENRMYPSFNEFLMVAFTVNVDLSESIYDEFRGVSDYHDWLLDMDGFDYEKFNPRWLELNFVQSFWNKYQSSASLKEAIEKYLSANTNTNLANRYFYLFCNNS